MQQAANREPLYRASPIPPMQQKIAKTKFANLSPSDYYRF